MRLFAPMAGSVHAAREHTQAAMVSLLGWSNGTAAPSQKSPPACGRCT